MLNRRGLITGLVSFVAAPAIVRAASLMPVKAITLDELPLYGFSPGMAASLDMVDFDQVMREWARIMCVPDYGAVRWQVIEGAAK